MIIVIVVIVAGAFEVDVSNWSPFAPYGVRSILTGATVVFFAYVGFDAVANSAEESKKPQVCCLDISPMVYEFSRCYVCCCLCFSTNYLISVSSRLVAIRILNNSYRCYL